MAIIIRLDRVLVEKKMKLNELTDNIGISIVNLSNLKTGKYGQSDFQHLTQFAEL